jgi:hypothetical protein
VTAPPGSLPTVVVSSVVRSAHQGESHGGVYVVDLAAGRAEQVLDWDDPDISWDGRGADRGLRGIAIRGDEVFLAASDEIFVYDRAFRRLRSFTNPYLKHCHEIALAGGSLFVTSTGFDSVLEYDLHADRFVRGYTLRFPPLRRVVKRLRLTGRPRLTTFDPMRPGGPPPRDTSHVNSVTVRDGSIFVAGTRLNRLVEIRDSRYAGGTPIPYRSHNAQPVADRVLLNHTATDRIAVLDRRGRVVEAYAIPTYDPDALEHATLGPDHARQGFGRGLVALADDLIVGGSSPATVSAYRRGAPEPIASVNLTMDMRNAIHGLAVWPFDPAGAVMGITLAG